MNMLAYGMKQNNILVSFFFSCLFIFHHNLINWLADVALHYLLIPLLRSFQHDTPNYQVKQLRKSKANEH